MMLSESQEIKHKTGYIKENCNLLGLVLLKTVLLLKMHFQAKKLANNQVY